MPRLNIIAHTTPSHEHTVLWLMQQRTSVERWTKGVRRKERTWKKKPVKRQSWSTVQWHASTRPSVAGHGSKPEWTCFSWPSLVHVFTTSCFLHEKESPCCLCPLPIASRWSVTVSSLCRRVPNQSRSAFFRCLFRVANRCAVFFFSSPKQVIFPRLLTERKTRFRWNTRPCFSSLWLLRVTGNCFWFLDRPPVSKGLRLMCSPSLHLLLVFVLVVRIAPLLEIYFFTDRVCGFFAIRSIRVDCWILKLF